MRSSGKCDAVRRLRLEGCHQIVING